MTEFANYLMEHAVRIELTSSDWKSDIITIILYMHILARAKGIEPLSVVLETTIIPLYYTPTVGGGGGIRTHGTCVRQISSLVLSAGLRHPSKVMVDAIGLEPMTFNL